MAVRAIDDAIKHGGLLKKAITQLVLNFQMAGRQAKYVGGSFASLYPENMASVSHSRSAYIRDARSSFAVARCKNWASVHVGCLGRELAQAAIEIDEAGPVFLSAGFHSLQNHFQTWTS